MSSFRARLAWFHLAITVTVLGVTALAGYWLLSRAAHDQLDSALLSLARVEAELIQESPGGTIRVHEVPAGPAPPSLMRLDRLVQIVDSEGQVLARSSNLGSAQLPAPPSLIEALRAGAPIFETLPRFAEEPVRMVSVPVQDGERLLFVQVAGSLDDTNHVVTWAGILFTVMGLALIAAVGFAGTVLTGRVFKAIDNVVHQARRIGQANLGDRLPHPGTGDEIGRLVDTLNDMLGRIEQSFEAQRRFTSDASHELRSPLSRLRTELEVTLRRPREAPEYVQALRSCTEEVVRLTQLVDELLMLARLDAGQERDSVEAVFLNEVVEDVATRLLPLAQARDVLLVVEPAPPVASRSGRASLNLVISNLLDNAIKFTPAGGRVTVQVGARSGEAFVRVSDTGPGLTPGELPHLFDRFYRGSAARMNEVPGMGLGLALSRAIMEYQGGRIDATNAKHGGAEFCLHTPLAEDAAAAIS